jgi:hypothetical protein
MGLNLHWGQPERILLSLSPVTTGRGSSHCHPGDPVCHSASYLVATGVKHQGHLCNSISRCGFCDNRVRRHWEERLGSGVTQCWERGQTAAHEKEGWGEQGGKGWMCMEAGGKRPWMGEGWPQLWGTLFICLFHSVGCGAQALKHDD